MACGQLTASRAHWDSSVIAILVVSLVIKVLLIPSYRSTDFEVHRNWLSITHSLPRSDWYHEATSEWTLDYPPFFAWFEYALSCAAVYVDPFLVVISKDPIVNGRVVLFQRFSVMLSDCVLFYGVTEYCATWPTFKTTEQAFTSTKRTCVMLLTLLDAGLLYVDHIHFQYNGMLLGLLILSAARLRANKDLQGALLYAVLLMFKHIYLYVAPLYFVYLLRHQCYTLPAHRLREMYRRRAVPESPGPKRKRSLSSTDIHETIQNLHDGKYVFSWFRFVRLGALVVSVFAVALGSVLWTHPDPIAGLKQILSRLFPVQRGLCHAYWAPNVWALYAFLDKMAVFFFGYGHGNAGKALMSGGLVQEAQFAMLPAIPPVACALATFACMVPVLYSVWRYPDSSLFMSALVYCMMCSFMWGYHVHEKAILQVTLPLALMAAEGVHRMRLYRVASIVSNLSLFPLLFTPAEQPTKVLLALMHACLAYSTLDPLLKQSLRERRIRIDAVRMHVGEILLLTWLLACIAIASSMPLIPKVAERYPFLPLLVYSVSCAVANVYVWIMALYLHFRQLYAVKSYLHVH